MNLTIIAVVGIVSINYIISKNKLKIANYEYVKLICDKKIPEEVEGNISRKTISSLFKKTANNLVEEKFYFKNRLWDSAIFNILKIALFIWITFFIQKNFGISINARLNTFICVLHLVIFVFYYARKNRELEEKYIKIRLEYDEKSSFINDLNKEINSPR